MESDADSGKLAEARRGLRGRDLPEMRLVSADGSTRESDWQIRVYAERGGGSPVIAVITELSREADVMNRIEDIAAECAVRHALPTNTLWILHVPEAHGRPHPAGSDYQGDQLIVVTFLASESWSGLRGVHVVSYFDWLGAADADRLRSWIPLGGSE